MQIYQKKEEAVREKMNNRQRAKVKRLIRHAMTATAVVAIGAVVIAPRTMADTITANGSNVAITIDNNVVTSGGSGTVDDGDKLDARSGGSITLDNSILNADGANGITLALNGGTIDISNTSITGSLEEYESLKTHLLHPPKDGVGVQNILIQGTDSVVSLTNTTIDTTAYDYSVFYNNDPSNFADPNDPQPEEIAKRYHSTGIAAQSGGSVQLGGNIEVHSHGYRTYGISADGSNGHVSNIDEANNPLTLTVTTDGDWSPGIFSYGSDSTIDLDGTDRDNSSVTTTGANSDGVKIQNGSTVTLHNITVNPEGTDSAAVRFVGDGAGEFTGDKVTLNGDIISEDSGTNTVNLNNGSILNGNVTGVDSLVIDAGSTWNSTGDSVIGDFTNNGTFTFAPPADPSDPDSYDTLTVDHFHGKPDVPFEIHVFSDGEDSLSNKLIINDSYDGPTTTIEKNFTNGYHALPENGLVVVQGTSDDAFHEGDFVDPSKLGIYTYYGSFSTDPQTNDPQFALFSKINSAVAAVSVLPALGARTILSTLPTVQDRMHAPRSSVTGTGQGDADRGVWARLFGGSNKFRSNDGGDVGFDTSLWAVQAGYDFIANKSANGGRNYAGLYLAYGNSKGDAEVGGDDVGNVELNATSLGAYWTKYTPGNAYLSVTGQYSWLGGVKASGEGERVTPDGSGFAISVEGGKTLNEDKSMLIEPQAQLIYQHTDIDNVVLPAGGLRPDDTPLSLSNMNTVSGRLGVLFQKNPKDGENFLPWARVNLWHTFSGSSDLTTPLSDSLKSSMKGTSLELRAGFNFLGNEDSKFSVSGDGGYLFGLGGAKNSGWRGSVGVNYKW